MNNNSSLNLQTTEPATKDGWVNKLGEKGIIRTWSRRFFRLTQGGLAYFLDENPSTQRGNVPLNEIVWIGDSSSPTLFSWSTNGAYWQINSKKGRIYYLYSDNKEDAVVWIDVLNKWKDYQTYLETKENTIDNNLVVNRNRNISASPQPYNTLYPQLPNIEPTSNANSRTNTKEIQDIPKPKINSPYADFLDYQPKYNIPTFAQQTSSFIATYDDIVPTQSTYQVLQPPLQPPRPLRILHDNFIKEINFQEGDPLKAYREIMVKYCDVLTEQISIPQFTHHLLCTYLILSSLDWDNRNFKGTPFPSAPSYDSDPLSPYLAYSISLTRREILSSSNIPSGDAPTLITQIDTWVRRKRKDHEFLVQREDRESFIKRNVLLVHYVRMHHLTGLSLYELDDSLAVFVDRLLESIDQLPHSIYADLLWKGIQAENHTPSCCISETCEGLKGIQRCCCGRGCQGPSIEMQKEAYKNVIWAYMLFQKLKQEDDSLSFTDKDPYLANNIVSVLNSFSQTLNSIPFLACRARLIQSVMMKQFISWMRDCPLLYEVSSSDFYSLFLRNIRIVGRVGGKVHPVMFQRLQGSLLELVIALQKRMPAHSTYSPSTPFPSIPTGSYGTTLEDVQELCNAVRKSIQPK